MTKRIKVILNIYSMLICFGLACGGTSIVCASDVPVSDSEVNSIYDRVHSFKEYIGGFLEQNVSCEIKNQVPHKIKSWLDENFTWIILGGGVLITGLVVWTLIKNFFWIALWIGGFFGLYKLYEGNHNMRRDIDEIRGQMQKLQVSFSSMRSGTSSRH